MSNEGTKRKAIDAIEDSNNKKVAKGEDDADDDPKNEVSDDLLADLFRMLYQKLPGYGAKRRVVT